VRFGSIGDLSPSICSFSHLLFSKSESGWGSIIYHVLSHNRRLSPPHHHVYGSCSGRNVPAYCATLPRLIRRLNLDSAPGRVDARELVLTYLRETRRFEHGTCAGNLCAYHDVICLYSARIEGTVIYCSTGINGTLSIRIARATLLPNNYLSNPLT
jgi:hypothetical protein